MADNDVKQVLKEKISSKRGQNFLTFLIFLVIASGLWIVMSLNDTKQREYSISVAVSGLPEGGKFVHDDNTLIGSDGILGVYKVIVKERGLFSKSHKKTKSLPLNLNFTDFQRSNDGSFYLPTAKMESAMQTYLGENVIIVTWKPSVISFKVLEIGE